MRCKRKGCKRPSGVGGDNSDDDGADLIVCDLCNVVGARCLKCAGLDKAPDATEPWYCGDTCKDLASKRERTGYILPSCTYMVPAKANWEQFWMICQTCSGTRCCLSCAATCHAGHEMRETKDNQSVFYDHDTEHAICECGRDRMCDEAVLRKAARVDAMLEAQLACGRAAGEWENHKILYAALLQEASAAEAAYQDKYVEHATDTFAAVRDASAARKEELHAELKLAISKPQLDTREICMLSAALAAEDTAHRDAAATQQRMEDARIAAKAQLEAGAAALLEMSKRVDELAATKLKCEEDKRTLDDLSAFVPKKARK